MRTTSIRWRLLLWLALLLVAVLGGFGTSVFLYVRAGRLGAIDEALEQRVAALAFDVRQAGGGDGGGPGFRPNAPGGPGNGFGPGPRSPDFPEHDEPAHEARRRSEPPAGFAEGARATPPSREKMPRTPPTRSGNDQRKITLSPETAALLEGANSEYYYAVWSRHGPLLKQSANAPELSLNVKDLLPAQTVSRTRGAFRETTHVTEREDRVLVGLSLVSYRHDMWRLALMLTTAGLAVLVLAIGVAWMLVTRALRPVGEIGRTAQRIAAGNLAERIRKTGDEDELNDLADVLNSTFARLESAFAEQKQFTADASHELRTPLSVIIAESQSALARPRSGEEYRETVENCLEAAQDMRRLAESLLTLARLDSGQNSQNHSALDLADLAHESLELIRPLAATRHLQIATAIAAAPMTGDPVRLKQVLLNLLDNAIYYNVDGGTLRVETKSTDTHAVLVIEDSGQGIAPEDVPNIFNRFYRADKARSNVQGRSGLGLAIVKSIVENHGGTVRVESTLGTGSTFTVRLPALRAKPADGTA